MPSSDLMKANLEARILQVLSEFDLPQDGVRIGTTFGGRSVLMQISASAAARDPGEGRTECERDCLAVLRAASGPLTRAKIREALEASGRIWGESTVATALADLVSDGVLENSRKRGGYYLPGLNDRAA